MTIVIKGVISCTPEPEVLRSQYVFVTTQYIVQKGKFPTRQTREKLRLPTVLY
jgi:hypothetical protein